MKKNKLLTVLCSILFLVVCGCGDSSSTGFVRQPESMNIAPNNQGIDLVCEAKAKSGDVTYQWYESSNGTTNAGTAVEGATDSTFKTPVYTEKGVHYYYCVATADSVSWVSKVASVAHTGLPTLYINTPDAVEIVSKDEWIEKAEISLTGAKDESWNFDKVATSIKGRGNSMWALPKKPYALKLDKKQKIMGMPAHKRWVLMANYRDNSFMKNDAYVDYLKERVDSKLSIVDNDIAAINAGSDD